MQSREITKTLYKVSDFLSWQKGESLVLSPYFQRRPLWSAGAKSYLMDTIVRGLPVPIIFLREQKTDLTRMEPKRQVVDGQQRIRTVLGLRRVSEQPPGSRRIIDTFGILTLGAVCRPAIASHASSVARLT
jgi:hypothetical protein